MILNDCKLLAEELLKLHGLSDWLIQFDNALNRFGYCQYSKKVISLSRSLVELNSIDIVKNTILHEIAHALCPIGVHHGKAWQDKALSIGCDGKRCYDTSVIKKPIPKHFYKCNNCGYMFQRIRRIKRLSNSYHIRCGKYLGKLREVNL
jgi:predicted SprT family Zn-dependent metalloprotease